MQVNLSIRWFGILVVLIAGCQKPASSPTPASTQAAPTSSRINPKKVTVKRNLELPGNVQAFETATLFARVPGYVKSLAEDPNKRSRPEYDRRIDIGSVVKTGQLLAELSAPELTEEHQQKIALVRQAEAEVTLAKKSAEAAAAGITLARAQVGEANAALERAEAFFRRWQSEADRVTRLASGGVVDAQSRDEATTQLQAAKAAHAEAKAKVTSAHADVTKATADREKSEAEVVASQARLEVAQAAARSAKVMANYLNITAPFAGVVTQRQINVGDFIAADGRTSLFALTRTDPLRVVVQVPETEVEWVKVGQKITIAFGSGTTKLDATVARTSWSLETGSSTLRTEIDLPNSDGSLRPGMFATVKLSASIPEDWALPNAAIVRMGEDAFVFLEKDGKAIQSSVELRHGDTDFTQIKRYRIGKTGDWHLVTGDEVILSPAAAMTDGQPTR